MIYLTTGGNGAGKTLLTLRDVREKSLKENRPVYYNGRFDLVADFGWIKCDFKDWQTLPDGSIFIVDECHNDMPVRSTREPLPEHIKMLAEHRRRGFDFYLITQHPLNIDSFVRRLISSPGWHRHLKRASGAPLVSVLEWPAVNDKCEKNGSGASAATSMVAYPKEVYAWYNSTSLDTAKIKIPFQVKMLVACLLLVPLLGYYGWQSFKNAQPGAKARAAAESSQSSPGQQGAPGAPQEKKVMSAQEYAQSFQPRIEGLAYTAARYDESTRPVNVPYPAACIQMGTRCECFTQQATKLPVPLSICVQIVAGGFFNDWDTALKQAQSGVVPAPSKGAAPVQVQGASVVPVQLAPQTSPVVKPSLRPSY